MMTTTTEAVNQTAIDRHASGIRQLWVKLESAEKHLASLSRPSGTPDDPAYVNLKGHRKNLDHDIDKGVALHAAERSVEQMRKILEGREANWPHHVTKEALAAAKVIRTGGGWHKVVRVNAKTVTVETPYSWTDRLFIKDILEVR